MPARYETIADWANRFGWTKGAELGVLDGRTFLYLLAQCPQIDMIGVDVWDMPGFTEGPTRSRERCFCGYCSATRALRIGRKAVTMAQMRTNVLLESAIYGARAVIIQERTTDAAAHVPDRSLDFVFVDGDHSTEGVLDDIDHWLPKIRLGGRLIGHDWNMQSVRDAVLMPFPLAEVRATDDHVWWVQC